MSILQHAIIQKLLHTGAKLLVGKEMATIMMLVKLILDALNNRDVTDVARFVYQKFPREWKAPAGPATESEFIDMAQTGQAFIRKVKAVLQ